MVSERKHVICRACHAHCGLIVDFQDGTPVATHGDKDNPAFHGYSCIKGRQLADYHTLPTRLLHSQKRMPDGTHAPIAWRAAADEMADRLTTIIDRDGPDAVALYVGTFGYTNLACHAFGLALMDAIKSRMVFTSVTIDQPGKGIALGEHGPWLAGPYRIAEWDGLMLVGTNPIVSQNGGLGTNPARNLHEAKKRGMQLIVIDPRRTDCAEKADLHLQCRPGEDAVILAAITRQIIEDGAFDRAFVSGEVAGLEALKSAVAPFDPRRAAERAGLTPDDILAAARMYGSWRKGHISAGTGPNMSGSANIVEYLGLAMTSLMGHWRRAGELQRNEGVFINPAPAIAASPGPFPADGFGKKLRVRGLEETTMGFPTGALADEILTPGDGQIKALIVLGGNPMLAWPDQLKTFEAMKALELLVCFDPRMSKTGLLADYVIAPKLHYEIHGTTAATEMFGMFGAGWGFEETYCQVSEPIMDPPATSDLCEEFEFLHAVARRLGTPLSIKSWAHLSDPAAAEANRTLLDLERAPTPIEAWSASLNGAPVSVEEVFADPDAHQGKVFDRQGRMVVAKPGDWEGKLSVGAPAMMAELAEAAARLDQPASTLGGDYPFRLISRRLNDMHNSNWHEDAQQRKRVPNHPAFINPADLEALSLTDGDVIEIESERASIHCVARAAPDVRPGCLSVPHAWGTNPDEAEDPIWAGGNTGRLSFNDRDFDKRTGIPLMSAIPVAVRAAARAPATGD